MTIVHYQSTWKCGLSKRSWTIPRCAQSRFCTAIFTTLLRILPVHWNAQNSHPFTWIPLKAISVTLSTQLFQTAATSLWWVRHWGKLEGNVNWTIHLQGWNEKCVETQGVVNGGIVKYKLTPNLDLAKLASIRQFPKLNYQTKSMHCGESELLSRWFL